MEKREARLYWFKRPKEEKDILIFDAGYESGDIHVYEHKETLPAEELQNQLKQYGNYIVWELLTPERVQELRKQIELEVLMKTRYPPRREPKKKWPKEIKYV